MWYTNFQLTDAEGNLSAGRLAAWVLLCLAACVSALFALYVNANNDKLEKVLQAKDKQIQWMVEEDTAEKGAIFLLLRQLDSCHFSRQP